MWTALVASLLSLSRKQCASRDLVPRSCHDSVTPLTENISCPQVETNTDWPSPQNPIFFCLRYVEIRFDPIFLPAYTTPGALDLLTSAAIDGNGVNNLSQSEVSRTAGKSMCGGIGTKR